MLPKTTIAPLSKYIPLVYVDMTCKSFLSTMTSSNGNIYALLALCAGNSPATGEFPSQRPVTRSFDVFFHLRLNGWINNREAGGLRRPRHYYDAIECMCTFVARNTEKTHAHANPSCTFSGAKLYHYSASHQQLQCLLVMLCYCLVNLVFYLPSFPVSIAISWRWKSYFNSSTLDEPVFVLKSNSLGISEHGIICDGCSHIMGIPSFADKFVCQHVYLRWRHW